MNVLHMMKSATDTICESFVIELQGAVVVVDGGFESEAEVLFAKLKALGGHVDGWFLTHPHDDHMGAFCRVMENHGDEIRVDALYSNFLPEALLCEHDEREAPKTRKYLPWIDRLTEEHSIRRVTMHRGDVYEYGEATVHVLREPDAEICANCINNSSVVFRLDVGEKRVLFLGDLGSEGGHQLLETVPAQELTADYVQMAHHGQNGVERQVYEVISPRCCLWCTPTWLWDNMGEHGYDSGIFRTVVVRGWMSEIGVRRHYVNMNGPHAIGL